MSVPMRWRKGGCHCGSVRFEVECEDRVSVEACNCSICRMTGFLHLIVPASRFRLISGKDQLTEYTFNTGVAKHLFCKRCGVKSFYAPRSNPDGFSVNLRCLDEGDRPQAEIREFDGQNWEANAGRLAGLSKDG